MNAWTMSVVGPHSFTAKWYAGRARPEEVIWAIKKGKIEDGVPNDIRRDVQQMRIESAREFTAYREGAPRYVIILVFHEDSLLIAICFVFIADEITINTYHLVLQYDQPSILARNARCLDIIIILGQHCARY